MKMVNADDLKKEISKAPVWTALAVKEMIDGMTETLVRCKECYMCDEEMWCSFYDSIMESDDYCSYGDRSK